MKSASWTYFIDKVSFNLLFVFLFLYQLCFTFQGVNVADEGFHATFYNLIFKDPESVQYNFMFWFSGIVGGVFHYFFSGLGLWGIRLEGTLVITATMLMTYALLKKHIRPTHLKVGLVLAVILINNNHKTLYYDNLSAFLYSLIAYFLFKGMEQNNRYKLFLAGLFVSLNAFTRLPNVLGVGLVAIIIFYGFLNKKKFGVQIQQSAFFIGGFLVTTAVVLLTMKVMGHLALFTDVIQLVFKMGTESKNSNYTLSNMIGGHFLPYLKGLAYTLLFLFFIIIPELLKTLIQESKYKQSLISVVKVTTWVFLALLVIKDIQTNELSLLLFSGLTILSGLFILLGNSPKEIKILMAMGLFIFLVYPFGSYLGLLSVGIYVFWLAVPLIIYALGAIRNIKNDFSIAEENSVFSFNLDINAFHLRYIKITVVSLLLALCVVHDYFYPFFDKRNRITQRFAIHNERMKGIFTTKERANVLNEVLAESEKYIRPGDYVLAYDCMPLFHYLTDTKPYMRNSWPYLYLPVVFKRELYRPIGNGDKKLPVVVWQKVRVIGQGAEWPVYPLVQDKEWLERNKARNNAMSGFLKENNYKIAWSNDIFDIYISPGL